jgi:hypothetical protein
LAKITRREAVFLGVTSADSRVFVREFLKERLEKHPVVHLPAVGHFLLAKSALQAGYKPENIHCSDISLYTGLLGQLLDPSAELPPYTLSPRLAEEWEQWVAGGHPDTKFGRMAFLLFQMKIIQMEPQVYMAPFIEDMHLNRERHVARVMANLKTNLDTLAGIEYRHRDIREVIPGEHTAQEIVVANPPIVGNGYSKMFDFGEEIVYDPQVEEFSWSKDYLPLYEASKTSPAPFLWSRYYTVEGFPPQEVVYASERRADKVDYWLYTKPEELDRQTSIKTFTRKPVHRSKYPLWGLDDEMTYDSEVRFIKAPDEQVNYYRDLFAHRLGVTGGDANFIMLVDGKVYGTLVLMGEEVHSLRGEYILLNSGFTVPSNVYRRPNRLLNWAITSEEFSDVFRNVTRKNRFYICRGVQTTVFSKYRKTKANNGIWNIRDRERQKNGTYKIWYNCDFRPGETFKDAVRKFLDEEKALANGGQE